MIPLGLKETKEIDFREPFKEFVATHYFEEADDYEDAIAEFMDIRQAMRTPTRDQNGVALLFEHFNQLYFVERRFFPPDRSLGIFFEWWANYLRVPLICIILRFTCGLPHPFAGPPRQTICLSLQILDDCTIWGGAIKLRAHRPTESMKYE